MIWKRKKTVKKEENESKNKEKKRKIGWLFGFYGISTFVGYLTPNPFLSK